LWDGAFCDSVVSIKYEIENIGSNSCDLNVAQWCDWDIDPDLNTNLVYGDEALNTIWQSDDASPDYAFGHVRVPLDDKTVVGYSVNNPTFLHPNNGHNWLNSELDSLMSEGAWDLVGADPLPDDKGILLTTQGITLAPGEKHYEEYVIFGWDNSHTDFFDAAVRKTLVKTWLRQLGMYRGDVNTDNRGHERDIAGADLGPATNGGLINVADVVYIYNFLAKGGDRPWPFDDQADVNNDDVVTFGDVIALVNFVFKGDYANIKDRNRFGPEIVRDEPIYLNPNWR
jgi:hypothetical protein